MIDQLEKSWFVYILQCRDDTLYAGITTDLVRRLKEHNSGKSPGARYTRYRLPVKMLYCSQCENRSTASRAESQIKKLTRQQKLMLISSTENQIELFRLSLTAE